ncbi:Uncharacterised protein [Vibrio cholerae]|nr:Uncharacterised protein [Vibrio cholerae]
MCKIFQPFLLRFDGAVKGCYVVSNPISFISQPL